MKSTTTFTFFSLLGLFTLVAGVGHAAYAPYTEDFNDESTTTSGTATPSEPAPESGQFALDSGGTYNAGNIDNSFADWNVVSGNPDLNDSNQYQSSFGVSSNGDSSVGFSSEGYINGTGLENITIAPGTSFSVSYDFQIQDVENNSSQTRHEFDLLADSGGVGSNGYMVRWQITGGTQGDLSIAGGSANASGGNDSSDTLDVVEDADDGTDEKNSGVPHGDTTYSMLIEGLVDGAGTLSLTATLSDGTEDISETLGDSTPLSGKFFGFSDVIFNSAEDSANTSTLTMNYDNLRVIPEPSSFGLLLLGGVTLLGRRRGRRK